MRWSDRFPRGAAALHAVWHGEVRASLACLQQLRRAGCLCIITFAAHGGPIARTTLFADGDLTTKVSAAGLALADVHMAAVQRVQAQLHAAVSLLQALLPTILAPFAIWCALDLMFGPAMAAAEDLAAVTWVVGRDVVLGLVLPTVLAQGVRWWVRRWVNQAFDPRPAAEIMANNSVAE